MTDIKPTGRNRVCCDVVVGGIEFPLDGDAFRVAPATLDILTVLATDAESLG